MIRIAISLAALCGFALGQEPFSWGAAVSERYFSKAEGREVPIAVRTPPRVDGLEKYPLIVHYGGPIIAQSDAFPYFHVRPQRGGGTLWGYRSFSAYDARAAIAFIKEKYPIDPDRVYLLGSSAGGSGVMHLASSYPDEFAGVLALVAAGNNYPLVNFRNLPIAFHHGDRDWTSAVCNARVQAQRMQALDLPVVYEEYAGAGHSIPKPHEPMFEWLFEQRRNPSPLRISHECEVPSLGRSHWFWILELEDPHQIASVEARVVDETVFLETKNVARFSFDLETLPEGVKRCRIGDLEFEIEDSPPAESDRRIYEAGAAANLYQGEPLLIVWGSQAEAAKNLQSCGGPLQRTSRIAYPAIKDSDLTPDAAAEHNLLLVGTPEENSVIQKLLPQLPIAIRDGALEAGNRPPLPLEGRVVSLIFPNPEHPDRLIYLLMPFGESDYFSREPQRFLSGSDGFNRTSQADLLVQKFDHQISRQLQFDKNWNWREFDGHDQRIPADFGDRDNLARAYLRLMLEKSGADFAMWWGPEDKGMWNTDFNFLKAFDPEFYTLADFQTQHRAVTTTLGGVSGADLKEIWKKWGAIDEISIEPAFESASVEDEKIYRIAIPMDLYIKLGQRRKNLLEPEPGPAISTEEVRGEIFGD